MVGKLFKYYYLHIIIWMLLLLFPFVTYLYEPEKIKDFEPYFLISHIVSVGFLALSFYLLTAYAGPKYFFRKRIKFLLFVLLGLSAYLVINYLIVHFNPTGDLERLKKEGVLFVRIFVGPTIIYFLCIVIGNMLFFYNEQARQKELNKQIELEKTTAELNLLKLQISPHFLFNTLNNIRWQVRKQPAASEDSIIKLSEILRYIIYEVENNRVELQREIEHLKNFMELQSLRLPVAGDVVLDVQPDLKNRLIHPLLFIHFVENAFKYGVDSKTEPSIRFAFINIAGGIGFRSHNRILSQGTAKTTDGIGLSNIRRRLELLYPNKYTLLIEQSNGFFDVTLDLYLDEN
ncbi:histidine kinase [Sphingobacterium oryzagri]|uniref:Histidine kinase n=1 Tax=Sphingobacterium oryzagri TaxID=3025669 RepID=A0ABY7WLB0_9SPHI|nr:histidine kinase [Sphingobacterium sp. KACC 22765]WDF70295.1 histidine kinase [Sphingobacterium sp. KACC 22765]